jgi:uncharacterized membrane protein
MIKSLKLKLPKIAISRAHRLVFVIIVLHLFVTILLAAFLNIWFDEAYSLHTTSQGILFSIKQALYLEFQPPLYAILLSVWRGLNDTIFFARLFSILCTSSTIYITFFLSKRFVQKIHPVWMSSVVAFNPYLIWAAVEVRPYAFAILFSALLLLFFFEGYVNQPYSLRARWVYFFLSVLGLYTHFFLAFILIANGLALVGIRRWKAFRIHLITVTISGLLFLPLFLFLVSRLPDRIEAYSDPVPLIRSFRFIVLSFTSFIIYIWKEPTFVSRILRLTSAIVILSVIFFAFKKNYRFIHENHLIVWIQAAVIGFFLASFLTYTSTSTLSRYAYPLFIPSILSFGSILSIRQDSSSVKWLKRWAVISLCVSTLSLAFIYTPLAKIGDWKNVALYLMDVEAPNQPIMVYNMELKMLLSYYYSGQNIIIPIPREQTFNRFNPSDFHLKDEQELVASFSKIPQDSKVVWLVTFDYHCPAEARSNSSEERGYIESCKILNGFLSRHYSTMSTKQFYKSSIRRLEKISD